MLIPSALIALAASAATLVAASPSGRPDVSLSPRNNGNGKGNGNGNGNGNGKGNGPKTSCVLLLRAISAITELTPQLADSRLVGLTRR
jgi:hypothetical protein